MYRPFPPLRQEKSQNCSHTRLATVNRRLPFSDFSWGEAGLYTGHTLSSPQYWDTFKVTYAPFMWRKLVLEGSLAYPTALPWADQLFFIFLTKPFTWGTKKFVSARMVIRLAGSTFFHGKVAFLAAPTFLRITRSRRVNQSMCERSWLGQRGQLFLANKRLPAFRTGEPYQSSVKTENSVIYLDYYARRVWGQVNFRKGFRDR